MAEKRIKREDESGTPLWEWLFAGVGLLLVVGVIVAMIHRGLTTDDNPSSFATSVTSVVPSGDGYVVTFRIENLGSHTAADLGVEGSLNKGGQKVESSNVNLSYVPGNSEREGGLFFSKDPRQYDLQIRPTGYEKP